MHYGHHPNGYLNSAHHNPCNFDAIVFAQRAVSQTCQILTNRRGNIIKDILETGGASTEQLMLGRTAARLQPVSQLHNIAQNALAATQAKAGNCGECAAIAFCLLHCWRVGPIAYCSSSSADHAFVMIELTSDPQSKAVIVDPWGEVFGYYTTLVDSKPIFRNPNIVATVAAPTCCILEMARGSVEDFESMDGIQKTSDQATAQQLASQPWAWSGI